MSFRGEVRSCVLARPSSALSRSPDRPVTECPSGGTGALHEKIIVTSEHMYCTSSGTASLSLGQACRGIEHAKPYSILWPDPDTWRACCGVLSAVCPSRLHALHFRMAVQNAVHASNLREMKPVVTETSSELRRRNLDDESLACVEDLGGSENDRFDMQRLGKKQEFKRNFNFLSSLGWCCATPPLSLRSQRWNLWRQRQADNTVGRNLVHVSPLADLKDWVSEFAPPQYQKILSYTAGWMSTLGWLAAVASGYFVVTTQIQAMIEVTRPDYTFTNWQYTLLIIAFVAVTIAFNTWGADALPTLEVASLIGHVAGFVVVVICLLVLCPKNSAHEVFVEFQANGGWSPGPAYLVSQVTIMYCNLGSDSVVHISEQVTDASWVVPRCMWWSYIGNILMGIVMLITMLFCIGPLETVIESDVPYLQLFNNTGSNALSIILNVIVFLLIFSGNITALATCSNEMWVRS
nr:putative amino-acid permease c15c4.04c [Quercus suber]